VTQGDAVEAEFQLNLAGGAGCIDGRKIHIKMAGIELPLRKSYGQGCTFGPSLSSVG